MSDISDLYPPGPAHVPPGLTAPSPAYRLRVWMLLLCLLSFVTLYLGLVVGSAYFAYWFVADPTSRDVQRAASNASYQMRRSMIEDSRRNRPADGWRIIGSILAAALCLFLVKGLFKWKSQNRDLHLEIKENQHPKLFAFIKRVCRDTHAPLPHRVFVSPEVNAAVFYHESILSLFVPAHKNLLIGLGLVNEFNLSEFKATLAHEFGHFSQQTMKLGRYAYTANRVIVDLVFGRDWLDDVVAFIGRLNIRIAIFAWGFMGILWIVRQTLKGLFRLINTANSALSREMEYNADLVAVSVAGSNALVHGLARLDFAGAALGRAVSDLQMAAHHKLYSRDLFYHQERAGLYLHSQGRFADVALLSDVSKNELPGEPIFKADDTSVPEMWATHPSNYDREVNAKRHFVQGPIDERSPWMLFDNADEMREQMTRLVYEKALSINASKLADPETVQALIDEEHSETTYDPRYHGLYDRRYLEPGEIGDLIRSQPAELSDPVKLELAHSSLYGEQITAGMAAHAGREKEFELLSRFVPGQEAVGKDFEFRGQLCPASDAGKLLVQVQTELNQDLAWMASLDQQAFRVHYAMASHLGPAPLDELVDRYRFHLGVQQSHAALLGAMEQVSSMVSAIAGRQLSDKKQQECLAILTSANHVLSQKLKAADAVPMPDLKNVPSGQTLGAFLRDRCPALAQHTSYPQLDAAWLKAFFRRLSEVIGQLQTLHFKSLKRLLTLQDSIAQRWSKERTQPTSEASSASINDRSSV